MQIPASGLLFSGVAASPALSHPGVSSCLGVSLAVFRVLLPHSSPEPFISLAWGRAHTGLFKGGSVKVLLLTQVFHLWLIFPCNATRNSGPRDTCREVGTSHQSLLRERPGLSEPAGPGACR